MRWGALAVAVALSASFGLGRPAVLAGTGLVVVALIRTLAPPRLRARNALDVLLVVLEVAVAIAAVTATQSWVSPYLFSLAATGVIVGYGFGLLRAAVAALLVGVLVTVAAALTSNVPAVEDALLGWSQVLLVYLVAGYARRIFVEESQRASVALSRVSRLTEANDLLFELYRVAQSLPVSLELGDTVALVVGRVRELLQPDVVVVLLPDDGTETWSAAFAEGARVRGPLPLDQLPPPLRTAASQIDAHLEPALTVGAGLGLSSRSGLYASLRARGELVGLIAVEKRDTVVLTRRDAQLLKGVGEQAALAIDNARLFGRLRAVGRDQERTRIARDLHDRVGQSLAYLAFELDRLVAKADAAPLRSELEGLRDDVRRAVTEVRETLYDLRTEVTEKVGIAMVLDDFVQRVQARSGLAMKLRVDGDARLPLTQERELLRIAQEAMLNVERHAAASAMIVSLRLRPDEAMLEVADDGRGFVHGAGRPDSYGLVGMRERADAIGAALEIDTAPGRGTTIRCWLRQPDLQGTLQ